jgi:hypothetical protein
MRLPGAINHVVAVNSALQHESKADAWLPEYQSR